MSETPLKQLTDSNSNNFYPVTSSSGVYRPDSSTVEAALATIPTATSDLENDSNFISEGQANSITGSMIQDNTITAGNINFATFGNQSSSLTNTSNVAFSSSGFTTVLSRTIQDSGTYLLIGVVSCFLSNNGYTRSAMFVNGTQLPHSPAGATPDTSYGDTAGTTCLNIAQCNAGDVVYLKVGGGNSGGESNPNRSSLAVVRIG